MKLIVDPAIRLLQQLEPGEPASLRQLSLALQSDEETLAVLVPELLDSCEELVAPSGMLMLTHPLDLLEPEAFVAGLSESVLQRLERCAVRAQCASTNSDEATTDVTRRGALSLALAEYQTGGRGRQGRTWCSGFARGLCVTLAFRVKAAHVTPTLTLAAGVAVATTLDTFLTESVLLKWPNDLILSEGKLGGILVEVSSAAEGDVLVRIGIGINVEAPPAQNMSGSLPALVPTGLSERAAGTLQRTALASELVNCVVEAVDLHGESGLAPFMHEWNQRDYLRHQSVQAFDQDRVRHGTALGINADGSLRVKTDEGELALNSGEVRVRRTRL